MIYALMLNDMREPNIENLQVVRFGEDRDALIRYHDSLLVPPYQDGRWCKTFAIGSELEWFNRSHDLISDEAWSGGIYRLPPGGTDAQYAALRLVKR